jgi:hypothetical protein
LGSLMDVRRRREDRERMTLPIHQNGIFRAWLAPIRGVLAGLGAPFLAGSVAASALARLQSIWPAMPSLSSMRRWSCCQTPARCHSRRRRQQVIPEPPPISWGSISQGIPEYRTNRRPVSAARSGRRGRPPLGLGGSGGSNGSISAQSASGNSSLAILGSYPQAGFVRRS